VIREGVLEKGMTPWEGILTPEQMNHAAAYVLSKNAEAQGRSIEELEASWEESGGGEGGTEEGAAEGAGGGSVGSA
jgi:hypothetical protein